ncbi:pectate lyase 8 [Spatholobus suberectus]|nr:pectate lyase 8 [Spatholobus suberectus]
MKMLSPRLFALTILLVALLSATANAINDNEILKQKATESRDVVEEGKLLAESLKNSSMAERSGDAVNEHAVDNPEEIASMVDA